MQIKNKLNKTPTLFIIWSMLASFGAYFSMYAFRKPLSAATFNDIVIWGYSAKTIFIISQVIGYMFSKFIGIKVISELKEKHRVTAGIIIISIAYLSLFLFAITPLSIKPYTLLINGLPLGMVWGVVFSFMEGRRVTELISAGLAISIIFSSGALKTISRIFIENFKINEYWMPFTIASIFLPLFIFFLWMLSNMPPPESEDVSARNKRIPMSNSDRIKILKEYGLGLTLLIIIYIALTICRDIRDNYAVEVWKQLGNTNTDIFYLSETPIALCTVFLLAFLIKVKSNIKAFDLSLISILFGIIIIGSISVLYKYNYIQPHLWMIFLGAGLYFAYIPFHCVLFERFFAASKSKGNAGYVMYLCDSFGYLGSIVILVFKELEFKSTQWNTYLLNISLWIIAIGLPIVITLIYYFNKKFKQQKYEYTN